MQRSVFSVAGRNCTLLGQPDAGPLLIQPVNGQEEKLLDQEAELLAGQVSRPFGLAAFPVVDWNGELSPWPAPPVWKDQPFGGRAGETLEFLTGQLLPALSPLPGQVILGGYSLAGLFALWAASRTGCFAGVAACSPSVWFPGWGDYLDIHPLQTGLVYLSLGDREEKTRNRTMAGVGDAIRAMPRQLTAGNPALRCTLEWNPGNHFREPELRMAKGFGWVLNQFTE